MPCWPVVRQSRQSTRWILRCFFRAPRERYKSIHFKKYRRRYRLYKLTFNRPGLFMEEKTVKTGCQNPQQDEPLSGTAWKELWLGDTDRLLLAA